MSSKAARNLFSVVLIVSGTALLGVTLIGTFVKSEIHSGNPEVTDKRARSLDDAAFWRASVRQANETESAYLARLTDLVNDRMLIIDPAYVRPGVFENWLLWGWTALKPGWEWTSADNAVRSGGGFSGQHAVVLHEVARQHQINGHITASGPHVINEFQTEAGPRVADAFFNVLIEDSLPALQQQPQKIVDAYVAAGLSADDANFVQTALTAPAEQRRSFASAAEYNPRSAKLEKLTRSAIWIVPALMIMAGLWLRKARRSQSAS